MDPISAIYGGKEQTLVHYERTGAVVTLTIRGMTNHEIRDVILGLWLRLDFDDRRDHINALEHYLLPEATPPAIARAIADAIDLPELRTKPQ